MVDYGEFEDCTVNKDLQNHIDALKDYADHVVVEEADVGALKQTKKLLVEIERFIHRCEKEGLPVPEGLGADKVKVEADINQLTGGSKIGQVYEALLPIVVRLGRKCQRPLQKDLREALTVDDRKTTSPKEFRDLIVQFLGESGGSASLPDVMQRIEQSLQGHFTVADLDQMPRKQWCRWKDNVRHEIRKMKEEHILARRSTSTLILVTHDKGMSRREQQGSRRLRWERAAHREDCFDLTLMNPGVLDVTHCTQLLADVRTKDGVHPPRFNRHQGRELQKWLDNLNTPLREQAYAALSNWFLTDTEHCKSSPLADAARELWNALFCAMPDRRLTDPKRDYKILPERFYLWWPKQRDCQNR